MYIGHDCFFNYFAEWAIGLSVNDTFIMRPIAVERPDAFLMQIKEGFFWYNNVKTEWSFMEVGIRYKPLLQYH